MRFESRHPAEQIARVMRRIYKYGMTTPSGGNLSVRDGDEGLWVTPSGLDKGLLRRGDIIHINPDDTYAGDRKPSVEYPFHKRIYQEREDVHAVIHAHSAALTAFALAHEIPSTLLYDVPRICGRVASTPYHNPGTQALSAGIKDRFHEGYSAVLMENHGCVVGARDLLSAFMAFETLEFTARVELNARKVGMPLTMTYIQPVSSDAKPPMQDTQHADEPLDEEEWRQRRELCKIARRAYRRRLFLGAMGIASVRASGSSFLITPNDTDRAQLKPEDIIRVATDRDCVGDALDPINIHQAMYRTHPHVNAILTAAPDAAMAFAVTDAPFDLAMIPEGHLILGDVRRFTFESVCHDVESVARAFDGSYVALIGNAFAITTGDTLLLAYDKLEVLNHCARVMIDARALREFND